MTILTRETLKVNGKYNWKGQPERLLYTGQRGSWYQFEKLGSPGIWCEVLSHDLKRLEETLPEPEIPTHCKDSHEASLRYVEGYIKGHDAGWQAGLEHALATQQVNTKKF